MKVYTRRGDGGETDLFGGDRVAKDTLRVEAYGDVDELNAVLGVCRAQAGHADLRQILERVQEMLFGLGAVLATPDAHHREKTGVSGPGPDDVAALERHIDAFDAELEPLRRFVLPGGCAAAASLHVARTVCRRAERRAVALHHEAPLPQGSLQYLNRLSDLLFVMARVENRRAGIADVEWRGQG